MKNNITIYINARTNSQRCKNKLVRRFANTTLIDIALAKMEQLKDHYSVVFAAYDDVLLGKARKCNITTFERSHKSVMAEDNIQEVFEVLKHIPTKYVAFLNPCCPFMTTDTVLKAVDGFFESNALSLSCVVKSREWLFFKDNSPVIPITSISTKTCDYVWRIAHTLHIYPRERFYNEGVMWNGEVGDPQLFEIPRQESLDIDFEEEFHACEYLYKQKMFCA